MQKCYNALIFRQLGITAPPLLQIASPSVCCRTNRNDARFCFRLAADIRCRNWKLSAAVRCRNTSSLTLRRACEANSFRKHGAKSMVHRAKSSTLNDKLRAASHKLRAQNSNTAIRLHCNTSPPPSFRWRCHGIPRPPKNGDKQEGLRAASQKIQHHGHTATQHHRIVSYCQIVKRLNCKGQGAQL